MSALVNTDFNISPVAPIDWVPGFRELGQGILELRQSTSLMPDLQRLLGACMLLASTGIWLLPFAVSYPETSLMCVGASVFLMFVGLTLVLLNGPKRNPTVQFDSRSQEVRVTMPRSFGEDHLMLRRPYSTLGAAEFLSSSVRLREADGRVLLEVPFERPEIRVRLLAHLRTHIYVLNHVAA